MPDYLGFRDCVVEQNEISPKLKLLGQTSVKTIQINSMACSDLISRLAELHHQLIIKYAENAVNEIINKLSNLFSEGGRILSTQFW